MPKIFDVTTRVLTQALKGTQRRHEVLSNNIANVDTPNFRAADYRFEEAIRNTLGEEERRSPRTERAPLELYDPLKEFARMVPRVSLAFDEEPGIIPEGYQQLRLDGNSTDVDREMGKLAQNTIEHHTYIQLLNAKLRMLRTAVKG